MVEPEVVAIYEYLFFDIRDLLRYPLFMEIVVFAAIREGTPYPYPRCIRRGERWACEDGG